jgi:Leucine-rich repeat (LRR) protein/predicted ATP-binding protein involved in virulence
LQKTKVIRSKMKKDILEQINEAKSSKTLSLFETQITDEIWQEIIKLTHLEYLYIYSSDIYNIPKDIAFLDKLRELRLHKCNLSSLPIILTKLSNIEKLTIGHNLIETFPDEFKNLINLKNLDISGNPIKIIPEVLAQLPKLEELDLSEIQNLSYTGLDKLKNIKTLNLNSNNLTTMPNQVFQLTGLQKLDLSQNAITEIPEEAKNLIQLIDINFTLSELKAIPKGISFLSNLERLDFVGNNKITTISEEVFELKKLTWLRLQDNQIDKIPQNIIKLQNLKTLHISKNKLKVIPPQIFNLQNLRDFEIIGNPIEALKFGYIISDKKHDFREIFNFDKSIIETLHGDNFVFLKDENNYSIVEFGNQPQRREHRYVYENFSYGSGFLINIFGETKTQKTFLKKITIQIDKWIKKQEIEIEKNRRKKFASRFFLYPIDSNYEKETVIDYDKLLKYKEAGENLYFDDELGRKFSVTDLLTYIGAEDVKIEKSWNGTDCITNVQIENFKLLKNIQFNITERINIVLGRNALGKTSILQAITLGLLPLDNVDKSNEFESFIRIGQSQSEIIISWGEEYRKAYIFKNELNEEKHIDFPQKLLLAYGVNLNTEIKLDHSKVIEHLISGNAIPYSTKSIFKDYSTDFYDPLILLEKLQIENSKKKDNQITSIINLIVNTINNYLSLIEEREKISLGQENSDFFFTDINKNKLKTQHLSEGYKDHILLITDIITRIISSRNNIFNKTPSISKLLSECKGVILIDEFDRHLHPVWQRRLLLQLKTDFPKIQFILTTHNLFSLQSAEGFNSLILGIKNGEITITEKLIKVGLSIKSIYNMYFDGNNKYFGYETEKLFTQFYELLVNVKKQKASEIELTQFRQTINQLLEKDEEVQVIISRELRQLERQTGKTFEL